MKWNEFDNLPENNKIVLLYIKDDRASYNDTIMLAGKFILSKGWLVGSSDSFKSLPAYYSVLKWLEIPLP